MKTLSKLQKLQLERLLADYNMGIIDTEELLKMQDLYLSQTILK